MQTFQSILMRPSLALDWQPGKIHCTGYNCVSTHRITDFTAIYCGHVGSPSVRQYMCKLLPDKGAGINIAILSGVDTVYSIHNSGYGKHAT